MWAVPFLLVGNCVKSRIVRVNGVILLAVWKAEAATGTPDLSPWN